MIIIILFFSPSTRSSAIGIVQAFLFLFVFILLIPAFLVVIIIITFPFLSLSAVLGGVRRFQQH